MQRLAIQLKLAFEASGYTRSEICDRCEIEPAALSKYLNGKMHPRKYVLTRLTRMIPIEHLAAVYSAYLLDNLPEGADQYLTIVESPQKLKESTSPYKSTTALPEELENAFAHLRTLAAKSTVIADSILSTSRVMKGVDIDKLDPQ